MSIRGVRLERTPPFFVFSAPFLRRGAMPNLRRLSEGSIKRRSFGAAPKLLWRFEASIGYRTFGEPPKLILRRRSFGEALLFR